MADHAASVTSGQTVTAAAAPKVRADEPTREVETTASGTDASAGTESSSYCTKCEGRIDFGGALSFMVNSVFCSKDIDGPIRDMARGIARERSADDYFMTYDDDTGMCVVVTSTPTEGGKLYGGSYLRYHLSGKILDVTGLQARRHTKAFYKAFKKLIAAEVGHPVTVLSMNDTAMEIVEGDFDPRALSGDRKYYRADFSTQLPGFKLDIREVPFEETKHHQTLQHIGRAENFFRKNLPSMMEGIADQLSPDTAIALGIATHEVAQAFIALTHPEEGNGTAAGHAYGHKYIDVLSGQGYQDVMSKSLHEIFHLISATAKMEGDGQFVQASHRLIEGLTELMTRTLISQNRFSIDFDKCPCKYVEADILYLLMENGILTMDDLVRTFITSNSAPLIEKIDDKFGVPLIAHLFYNSSKGGICWFKDALEMIAALGITSNGLSNSIIRAHETGMLTDGVLESIVMEHMMEQRQR